MDVRSPWTEIALHGRSIPPVARMESPHESRLELARSSETRRFTATGPAFESYIYERTSSLAPGRFLRRIRVDRFPRRRQQRCVIREEIARRRDDRVHRERHTDCASQLSTRGTARRLLSRGH